MSLGPAFDRVDDRFAEPLRRRPEFAFLLIALLFVGGARVHQERYLALQQAAVDARAAEPAATAAPSRAPRLEVVPVAPEDPAAVIPPDAVVVGAAQGRELAPYIAERRAALGAVADAAPDRVLPALVSLPRYLAPSAVDALLAGTDVTATAVRYRFAVPGSLRARVDVDGSVAAALVPVLAGQADQARLEARELEQMAATTADPAFAETFRRDRERLLAAADTVGPDGCECVYAVEVEGTAEALLALDRNPAVRLVDAAPPDAARPGAPRRIVFVALVPEDVARAGESSQAPDGAG